MEDFLIFDSETSSFFVQLNGKYLSMCKKVSIFVKKWTPENKIELATFISISANFSFLDMSGQRANKGIWLSYVTCAT